jgi:hypothetical protein
MTCLGRVVCIAGREFAAYFAAPIAYVVGVLFLVIQGFSFWAVVKVLADATRPAPMGAVLRTHFGGTFLYWSVLFMLIATTAMRLVADDRRQGNWEALLTTQVEEGEAIVGKWLGALAYYLVLWAPTAAYSLIIALFAPAGGAPEPGPIAAAYLGIAITGAGLLALALAAGAATANQIVAAVGAFVGLMALLLVGQLPELVPDIPGAALWSYVDLRAHMEEFSRGNLDMRVVLFYLGLTVTGLAFSTALAGIGRRRRRQLVARCAAAVLVASIAVLANALAARHPVHWDLTRSHLNSLAPRTRAVLQAVSAPVDVLILHAGEAGFAPVYRELDRIVDRMAAAQPLLTVRRLDPALEPARVQSLAEEFALRPDVLGGGGAVVLRQGERRRIVELLDLAQFGTDELGAGAVVEFRGERTLARALAEVSGPERSQLCVLHADDGGHVQAGSSALAVSPEPLEPFWTRAGFAVERIYDLAGGALQACRVVIAGWQRPVTGNEAVALAGYLAGGGRVFLALHARMPEKTLLHGLEVVLEPFGLRTPAAIVVDLVYQTNVALAWATEDGYGEHAITAGFPGRRVTLWAAPRAILVDPPHATALVSSSAAGWGETDVAGLFGEAEVAMGADDVIGPVAVAAAAEDPNTGARVVVHGSAAALTHYLDGTGNAAFAVAAVEWLAGKTVVFDVGDKTPQRVRLIMTRRALKLVFAASVLGIPGLWAIVGAALAWRRRRG